MKTNCVSPIQKRSKEYKAAMQKFNMTSGDLELILQEYQSLPENQALFEKGELPFPSNDYLQEHYYAPASVVSNNNVIKLWEKQYNKPIVVETLREANGVKQIASSYFDPNSITIKETNDGKYQVLVTKPLTSLEAKTRDLQYNLIHKGSLEDAVFDLLRKQGYIHKFKDQYVLTLGADTSYGSLDDINAITRKEMIDRSFANLQNALERIGLPKTLITKKETRAGGTAIVKIDNAVAANIKNAIDQGATIQDTRMIYDLAAFLGDKFNVEFGGIITLSEANKMTNNASPNAFIQNNKVYVVANRVSIDTVAEEFLHPFVNTLFKQNPEQFYSLYKEAKELFPELHTQILSNYLGRKNHKFTEDDLKQELVAQALSRHFREEYEASLKDGSLNTEQTLNKLQKFKSFVSKALNAIEKILHSISDKYYNDFVKIGIEELQGMTLRDIASIINAKDSSFWIDHNDITRYNVNSEAKVINNATAVDSITQKVINLTNIDSPVSASDVTKMARKVAYRLSDILTQVQNNPNLAATVTNGLVTAEQIEKLNRLKLLKKLGIRTVLNFCRDELFSYELDEETGEGRNPNITEEMFDEADLYYDNFDALIQLGTAEFAELEGFGIKLDSNGVVEADVVETKVEEETETDNENANIEEEEGNIQEKWQIDSRTLDTLKKASALIRQALLQCYKTNKDGSYQTDKWGLYDRVDARECVNKILNWTQGSVNYSSMLEKLSKHSEEAPWLENILTRLKDTSGKETMFQSQFFNVMCKHQQLYDVIKTADGKVASIPANSSPGRVVVKEDITAQYNVGEHPLFDSNGKVNLQSVSSLEACWNDLKEEFKKSTIDQETCSKIVFEIAKYFGFEQPLSVITELYKDADFKRVEKHTKYIIDNLTKNKDDNTWQPFSANPKAGGIINDMLKVLEPITDQLTVDLPSSFFANGKMYQSYITPSYLTRMFQHFKLADVVDAKNPAKATKYNEWLNKEFGQYEWFRYSHEDTANQNENMLLGWRNLWLKELTNDPKARAIIAHKVNLNYNGNAYMKEDGGIKMMSDLEYTLSIITEYFSETAKEGETKVPAWFRVPMLSNKPSSEFIRFFSYRGTDYKETVVNALKMTFDQELSRIQTVLLREQQDGLKAQKIKDFDGSRGKQFCFLDFIEKYRNDPKSELGRLINDKVNGKEINEVELCTLAKKAIAFELEEHAQKVLQDYKDSKLIQKIAQIQGVNQNDIDGDIINFVYNDFLANVNMTQMLITDKAMYPDAEAEQKRMAQVHSPGISPNIEAIDYYGNRVSDGVFRGVLLADFASFKSNIVENLKVIFDRKLATMGKNDPNYAAAEAGYKAILKSYQEINVGDGEGYSCPTSLRKKEYMFGAWTPHDEEIYKKIRTGKYDYKDLQFAHQTQKPFMYSKSTVSSGVDGPLKTLKVNTQYKDSEYLLIMAGAILQNEETGKPNILKAIYEVMEGSSTNMGQDRCLDTIMFESTTKTGVSGIINVNSFLEKDGATTDDVKHYIESCIYIDSSKRNQYNVAHVHESDYSDYCKQQELPAHFKNHAQAHGSQIRMSIVSDLNPEATYTVEGREVSAKDFRREYENTIADNINDSLEELVQEFNIRGSRTERNKALSKILQKEILSSTRYGADMLLACSLDENGEFLIPLGDPIQSKRVEQLLNSIIKNRVNNQKIAGGPVVQVSNYGTSQKLNIRFKDKNGNILKTREEYEREQHTESFEEYLTNNQAGVAYYEVFAPIYSDDLLKFMDEKGNIDVKAIEKTNPELLDLVTYRIPTEDKYSMAPCKIVGFLPREAGEAIMMPYEITNITGCDFDADKMFVMRKEMPIVTKETSEIASAMISRLNEIQQGLGDKSRDSINNFLKELSRNPGTVIVKNEKLAKIYREVAFSATRPTLENLGTRRAYRNNKIIDMTMSVLTHPDTVDKLLKPGGFDQQKRMGYMVQAHKLTRTPWSNLQSMDIKSLKKLCKINSNLSFIDTHVQFYKQNSAAGAALAIFAATKTTHAVLEGDGFLLDLSSLWRSKSPITIGTRTFPLLCELDPQKNVNGEFIGNIFGSCVASAADAVKDPVLNLMNINADTINVLNAAIRLGMTFEDAALILSSSTIQECLTELAQKRLQRPSTQLMTVINEKLETIKETYKVTNDSQLYSEPLTENELINQLTSNESNVAFKILLAYDRLNRVASAIQGPSFVTRFNSTSSAVGPLVIDNLIKEEKLTNMSEFVLTADAKASISVNDILDNHPILRQFLKGLEVANTIFGGQVVTNSSSFRSVVLDFPEKMQKRLYRNRSLLNKFGTFFESYLLCESDVVTYDEIEHYIKDFPKEFINNNYKETYKNNDLIRAIRFTTNNDNRIVLKIDTTGADQTIKDNLSSAWVDLYKSGEEGKKLAIDLFKYNFFKGGLGFDPRTFTHLLPVQLKQQIPGYTNTFKNIPSITDHENVIDLFVQNFYKEPGLVPKLNIDIAKTKDSIVLDKKECSLEPYFLDKNGKLFKQLGLHYDANAHPIAAEYKEIAKLGNKGEFLEISKDRLNKPIFEQTTKENTEEDFDIEITDATDVHNTHDPSQINDENTTQDGDEAMVNRNVEIVNRNLDVTSNINDTIASRLSSAAKAHGVTLNESKIENKSDEFC